jgi:hypothetical protein
MRAIDAKDHEIEAKRENIWANFFFSELCNFGQHPAKWKFYVENVNVPKVK